MKRFKVILVAELPEITLQEIIFVKFILCAYLDAISLFDNVIIVG